MSDLRYMRPKPVWASSELVARLPDRLRPDDVTESGVMLWSRALSDEEITEVDRWLAKVGEDTNE